MSYPRCAAVAAVAAFGGLLVVVSVATQVSTNKINPSPPAVPPPPPSAPCCWFIPITAVDLADVVVALPVTPLDRIPPWVDLVSGFHSKLLPCPVQILASLVVAPNPQQSLVLEFAPPTWWLRSWCLIDFAASPWDPGASRSIYLRRRLLPHLQVVGVFFLRRLHRPAFNRRTARSPPGCMRPRRPYDPPPAAPSSSPSWIAPPCSSSVPGPLCNLVFFRGPLCNLAVVIP
jgi:hypothetical protein